MFFRKNEYNIKNNLKNKNNSGFTLIEIVISIFILSFAITAIFNAFSIVVILTSDTVNQLTGAYLAQEGIEIVRNIRDNNWLNIDKEISDGGDITFNWLSGFNTCENGCMADYKTKINLGDDSLVTYSGQKLKINSDGFYENNNGTDTIFQRKIIIKPIEDFGQEDDDPYHIIKVTVQVSWDKKATIINQRNPANADACNLSNCIKVEETLYNWYDYRELIPETPPIEEEETEAD